MTTITQVITTLPAAPDPATMTRDEFSAAAAASVLAQKAMVPELNTWSGQVNTVVAELNTVASEVNANAFAAAIVGATAWESGVAVAQYAVRFSLIDLMSYRVNAARSAVQNVTDPSLDPTYWVRISASAGANTFNGNQTIANGSLIEAGQSIAAHATAMNPWTGGNYVTLTGGAVTITDLTDAPQIGAEAEIYMNAAHVWTNNANLVVDGGVNYTAAIGDRVIVRARATNIFTVHPRKASGAPIARLPEYATYQSSSSSVELVSTRTFQTFTGNTRALTVMFSNATAGTVGDKNAVRNNSVHVARVVNQDADLIGLVAPGATATFELVDNSTANGAWAKSNVLPLAVVNGFNRSGSTTWATSGSSNFRAFNGNSTEQQWAHALRVGIFDVICFKDSSNYAVVRVVNRKTGEIASSDTTLLAQNISNGGVIVAIDSTTFMLLCCYGGTVYINKFSINPATMAITAGTAYTNSPGGTPSSPYLSPSYVAGKFIASFSASATHSVIVDSSTDPVTVGSSFAGTIGQVYESVPLAGCSLVRGSSGRVAAITISGTTGTVASSDVHSYGPHATVPTDSELVCAGSTGGVMYLTLWKVTGTTVSKVNHAMGGDADHFKDLFRLPGTNKVMVTYGHTSTTTARVAGLYIVAGVGAVISSWALSTTYDTSSPTNAVWVFGEGENEFGITYLSGASTWSTKIISVPFGAATLVADVQKPSYGGNPAVNDNFSDVATGIGAYARTSEVIFGEKSAIGYNSGYGYAQRFIGGEPTYALPMDNKPLRPGSTGLLGARKWQRMYYDSNSPYQVTLLEAV